jgi:hypothetical protein
MTKSLALVLFTSALLLSACGQSQQGPKGEQGPPAPQGSKGSLRSRRCAGALGNNRAASRHRVSSYALAHLGNGSSTISGALVGSLLMAVMASETIFVRSTIDWLKVTYSPIWR